MSSAPVTARKILGLSLPSLGVLAAEPLYLLFDAAVVGRLGALALAGLAIGGLVLAQVSTQLTFLSYGTTARAARMHGAGRERDAVGEGVQATWLAFAIGIAIVAVMQLAAEPVVSVLTGGGDI
ncbi:MATE family efflux transporter, partial [Rhodococcus sp. EPR-147]